jgi:UDPglucose 6-dehydrogenase/UDP-N-acetyl-D-galactosamine dehydrogenase
MDEKTADTLCQVYGLVTTVYRAPDIRTAEAAKVIENIQRDLNIALVNELSLIFSRMGLDTTAVLEAAGTKWNFHPYRPGLVGGHCILVDLCS